MSATAGADVAALIRDALGTPHTRVYGIGGREIEIDRQSGAVRESGREEAVRLHACDSGEPLAPGELPLARALRGEVVERLEVLAIEPRSRSRAVRWISAGPIRSGSGEVVAAVVTTIELDAPAPSRPHPRELLSPAGWARGVEQEIARAASGGSPATIAILRPCGVRSLLERRAPLPPASIVEIARLWLEISRATDLLGHWRADAVGLVLADCPASQGIRVMRRFVERIPNSYGSAIGLTEWDRAERPVELIARAEGALADAIGLGGGRIVVGVNHLTS